MALSFRYLIGDAAEPVLPGSPLWKSPLPMDRHHFQDGCGGEGDPAGFTHGDYFSVARRFLEQSPHSIPLSKLLRNSTHVDICLMKHGECYHPSKIAVTSDGHCATFVLNVAVSDTGRRIVDDEVAALKKLAGLSAPSYLPHCYGQGNAPLDDGTPIKMFLGEWFDGYHEFHLSEDGGGMSLWGEDDVPVPLSAEAAYLIYHQAASILTRYYNPETTEQISRWHHAAGDFVARCRGNRVDVRLITVRHYGPLLRMDSMPDDPAGRCGQVLDALVLFLVHLSFRMRLDRWEGIGEMAWADEMAVIGTWNGFLEGLSNNCFPSTLLPDPVKQFETHLSAYSEAEFKALAEGAANAFPAGPEEKALIETHLPSHMETLMETIRHVGFP